MKTILLYLFIINTLFAIDKIKDFTLLEKNEYLIVNYQSYGCFHSIHYQFKFNDKNVTIFAIGTTKKSLGTVNLTQKDKLNLNYLFTFYQQKHLQGCTTTDEIQIKYYKNTKHLSSKHYRDDSCLLINKFSLNRLVQQLRTLQTITH